MRLQAIAKRTAHAFLKRAVRVWASFAMRSDSPASGLGDGIPKRILLINGAHMGDVVISTSLIPVLRSAYPEAEIGFLTGSWSLKVVQGHPEIAFTHCIDHWRLNRNQTSFWYKLRHFWSTRRTALREIRELKYDMSLSIHCWFPDFLDLAWQAHVPVRLGFGHSWFAPFATGVTNFPRADFIHQGARMAEVLKPLQLGASHLSKRQSTLPASSAEAYREVCDLLEVGSLEQRPYIVIQMGSGSPVKELSVEFWREIAKSLPSDKTLLFTGKGLREEQRISSVIHGLPNCINGCKLSWQAFVAAVRSGEMLYGVDSMAGHIAAAVGTECTVVYAGLSGVARWRPEGNKCTVFTQHVSCAPCGRAQGCADMHCLRTIIPSSLIHSQLPNPGPLAMGSSPAAPACSSIGEQCHNGNT